MPGQQSIERIPGRPTLHGAMARARLEIAKARTQRRQTDEQDTKAG